MTLPSGPPSVTPSIAPSDFQNKPGRATTEETVTVEHQHETPGGHEPTRSRGNTAASNTRSRRGTLNSHFPLRASTGERRGGRRKMQRDYQRLHRPWMYES